MYLIVWIMSGHDFISILGDASQIFFHTVTTLTRSPPRLMHTPTLATEISGSVCDGFAESASTNLVRYINTYCGKDWFLDNYEY